MYPLSILLSMYHLIALSICPPNLSFIGLPLHPSYSFIFKHVQQVVFRLGPLLLKTPQTLMSDLKSLRCSTKCPADRLMNVSYFSMWTSPETQSCLLSPIRAGFSQGLCGALWLVRTLFVDLLESKAIITTVAALRMNFHRRLRRLLFVWL